MDSSEIEALKKRLLQNKKDIPKKTPIKDDYSEVTFVTSKKLTQIKNSNTKTETAVVAQIDIGKRNRYF